MASSNTSKDARTRKRAAGAETLKDGQQLRVPVLQDQKRRIEANARAAGLPVATFLRNLGLNHQVTGVLDHEAVADLARVNGDLGRLGGLFKLFLTSDDKLAPFGGDQRFVRARVLELLRDIAKAQRELEAVMERVVR